MSTSLAPSAVAQETGAVTGVVANGTNGNDAIAVTGGAGGIETSGLAATVGILHSGAWERPTRDQHARGKGQRRPGRVGCWCNPTLRGWRARPVEVELTSVRRAGLHGGPPARSAARPKSLFQRFESRPASPSRAPDLRVGLNRTKPHPVGISVGRQLAARSQISRSRIRTSVR